MILPLSGSSLLEAKQLIEASGLSFEANVDRFLGYYEQQTLVATGARDGKVFKMLTVHPDWQGGQILGEMVNALLEDGLLAGYSNFLIYTKAEYASVFQAFNFECLVNQGKVALLEYGQGLMHWLTRYAALKGGDRVSGAIVMNCNPFTLGHRYLIETAASRVDHLYVFIVREDKSLFPFKVRERLLKAGISHLSNVSVLDTADYQVSAATFPTYFLKQSDPIAKIQMELDVMLFGQKIAPYFGISKRFVGSEPYCRLTEAYNETMLSLLPSYGIDCCVIDRLEAQSAAVSASRVRACWAVGDWDTLKVIVPESTLAFLKSEEGADLLARHTVS